MATERESISEGRIGKEMRKIEKDQRKKELPSERMSINKHLDKSRRGLRTSLIRFISIEDS